MDKTEPLPTHKETIKQQASASDQDIADRLRRFFHQTLAGFPWKVCVTDWNGEKYQLGEDEPHWSGEPLSITFHSTVGAKKLLSFNTLGYLEEVLSGEVDFEGNHYLLPHIAEYTQIKLSLWQKLCALLAHGWFQTTSRAKSNVKSHYDIPQEAINIYLDQVYMSYSCGMFEEPNQLQRQDLVRVGEGERDNFDSLEKAQWRKFKDAIDFIAPSPGESVLDIGCGYGGQLIVGLENYPKTKMVGWTHSSNQVKEGRKMLSRFDNEKWELLEGDYRNETRTFDHVTSTGMVSHVGPRGLAPYLRNIRKRIRPGGRYLHHALMVPYYPLPLDFYVGYLFHKKYVWPGFHWFTVGTHVKALEQNGFEVVKLVNLSEHYRKTTAAWYERLMSNRAKMEELLGDPTFRAWRMFLAGISDTFICRGAHVYRIYCKAV